MALLAWLPLINNIKNNGISDAATTALATVEFNSTGKIGAGSFKSGKEDGQVSNGISIASNFVEEFGDTASVAAWVMPLGNHYHYNGTIVSSGNWNKQKWAFGVSQDNTKVDVLCGSYNTYINCPVPVGEWTHLCSTYDHGVSKLYKNGEYIGELTGQRAFESDAENTTIGRETYASGYFGFYGSINDVRIYNHVLSSKEVKEISQGLILHYKLDNNGGMGNQNIISLSVYNSDPWKSAISGWTDLDGKHAMIVSNSVLYSKTSTGTTELFPGTVYKENTQYTISVDWRDDYRTDGKSSSMYFRFRYSDGTATNLITTKTDSWVHGTMTSTAGKTLSMIQTTYGNGGYLYLANIKVEEGTQDTGLPALDESIIYDSSGYGRNGVINGSLPIVYDTPRNTVSTYFRGSPNRIVGSYYATDTMTFSVWVNFRGGMAGSYHVIDGRTTSGNGYQPIYITSTTIQAGSSHSGGYINFNYTWATGKWYHIVITQDSTGCYFYVNGDQVNSATAAAYHGYGFNMELPLTVGARMNYSNHAVVYLSDLRVYSTALSPDDIKELYEVSMSISSYGDVLPYELLEDDEVSGLTKAGVLQSSAYLGNGDWMPYDQTIYTEPDGSQWVKIVHHNNPASKLFGSGNTFATTVYIDEDRWFNASLCDSVNQWEFMVKEAVAANGTELKYRWIQDANPMTAVYADVGSAKITKYTSEDGYNNFTSNWGGIYKKNSYTFLSQNNVTSSSWWGAIGSWTAYQGGIPGFGNNTISTHIIKTGYLDLYLRIDNLTFCETDSVARTYKNTAWSARQFIER